MTNPVLVEVLRGDIVEGVHRGAVAVLDANGKADARDRRHRPPRLSALGGEGDPGAAAGRERRRRRATASATGELALACASHSGEPRHVADRAGDAGRGRARCRGLECGAHWPIERGRAMRARPRRRRAERAPQQLLRQACRLRLPSPAISASTQRGYVKAGHPVQEAVRGALEDVTGAAASTPTTAAPTAARSRPMPCR